MISVKAMCCNYHGYGGDARDACQTWMDSDALEKLNRDAGATNMTTTDTKSNEKTARIQNWTQDDSKSVHGLGTYEQANAIRELTFATLKHNKQDGDYQIKVRKYPLKPRKNAKTTFSVLVFKKIGAKTPPIAGIVQPEKLDTNNLTATYNLKARRS